MKIVNLIAKERLGIGGLLNKRYQAKGLSLEMLGTSQKIIEKMYFNEEERKKIKMKNDDNRLSWDSTKDKGKEIELSDDQVKFLKEIIQGMSDSKEFSLEDSYVVDLIQKLAE